MDINIVGSFAFIFFLLIILVKSADLIEDSFVFIAKRIGISEFFIGFVILSAVSSLPEFSIALNANTQAPLLSVSNLLGASLILLTLIVGLTVIKFGSIEFTGKFSKKEIVTGLFVVAMSVLVLADGHLAIIESITLLVFYIFYISHIYSLYKIKDKVTDQTVAYVAADNLLILLGKSILGIVLILITSSLLVDEIISLGQTIDINESIIGIFILAVGTNIPELTILFRAKNSEQKNLAIGNFIGSACMNTVILGLLGLMARGVDLRETTGAFESLIPAMIVLTVAIFFFLIFSWTERKLERNEGLFLVSIYGMFIIVETYLLVT